MVDARTPRAADAPALLRDEQALVAALRSGDPGVTRLFLEHTHGAAYAFACRWTFDPDERRDWAHTALLHVLRDVREGRFQYRHAGGFWSWFRTRAGYLVLDQCRHARRRQRREGVPLDALAEGYAGTTDTDADPAATFDRVALRADVEHCLDRVPSADQRTAMRLLLEQEMSYDEIAAVMTSATSTVRNWIHRARVALRRCLAQRWGLGAGETSGDAGPSSEGP